MRKSIRERDSKNANRRLARMIRRQKRQLQLTEAKATIRRLRESSIYPPQMERLVQRIAPSAYEEKRLDPLRRNQERKVMVLGDDILHIGAAFGLLLGMNRRRH